MWSNTFVGKYYIGGVTAPSNATNMVWVPSTITVNPSPGVLTK